MVIGSGLVARAFNSYENNRDYLIFASGVSNSSSSEIFSFIREEEMLVSALNENPEKIFIYFSTCSIYDVSLNNSAYVKHKLRMENIIVQSDLKYCIFRLSNLAGYSKNPNTVLNYFVQHISSGNFFYLWKNSYRNIIDIQDAFKVCDYILTNGLFTSNIINIANSNNYSVQVIVSCIEHFLGKKGNYELIERTSNPIINIDDVKNIFSMLNITFDANYLERIIHKYFSVNDI
jgi:nucleoside-diphosphate-sugar epimerase